MIYAGVRWTALECFRRGFGESRIDANYAPDVSIAPASGHRGVTSLKPSAVGKFEVSGSGPHHAHVRQSVIRER